MSTPTKPGWVDVPGKGRRYWTGSEYRFYGPSDNPASKGQQAVSGDIAGMWNNFVSQFGRSTSDPTQVGAQNMTPAQIKQKQAEIAARNSGGSKEKNSAAPAKPANTDKPLPYGSLPGGDDPDKSAASPIAGKGPKGNEVGSDHDPDEPGMQGPGDPKGPPGARVNENGLLQYGKTLGGLNEFTKAFTGGYEIADLSKPFQSEALPTTEAGARQQAHGSLVTGPDGKPMEMETGTWDEDTGSLIEPTVPGTTGGKPGNSQDGTSSKPDIAEEVRTIRMKRNSGRGSRRDPRNRDGGLDEPFGGVSETVGTNGLSAKRRAIRSAFLDTSVGSVKASVRANAIAGYGKDSDGRGRFNVGGKLYYAKDGMEHQARNAAMLDKDTTQFLDMPTTPDTQPDTPADTEISPTPTATQQFKGLSDQPESVQKLVGMTQAPQMSADMPEFKNQGEADAFLSEWKKKAGLTK